jgi:hypothetical protein
VHGLSAYFFKYIPVEHFVVPHIAEYTPRPNYTNFSRDPVQGMSLEPKGFLAEVAANRNAYGDARNNPVVLFEDDAHRQASRNSVPPVIRCQVRHIEKKNTHAGY